MSTATQAYVNIAAYKFVSLDNLPERRSQMRERCQRLQIKGTILLSHEGINLFLAGRPERIGTFLVELRSQPEFADLEVKESLSDHQPFSRMLVRIKREIITLGVEGIDPVNRPSPKLPPQQLVEWLRSGKPVHLLDTRNEYEVEMGTFENAVTLGIDSFRQFPEAIKSLPEEWKKQPVVMFCTGGIRCEKAGPLMEREGFEQIYQLEGGILKYFEECEGAFYNGDCFVFDKRVAVNPRLAETDDTLCFACQRVLSAEDQQHPHYVPPRSCPWCFRPDEEKMRLQIEAREARWRELTDPLPGSVAYENLRPLNVPHRFDCRPVIEVLTGLLGHLTEDYWRAECAAGHIRCQRKALAATDIVRAGWRIEHVVPQTVEPDVNVNLRILYEDDYLVAVNKPAPLSMHPCGRFNRNTLIYLLDQVYAPQRLRLLHRLDANTTGVVVLARTKEASRQIHPQFARGEVEKKYLALVEGVPEESIFRSNLPISRDPGRSGGRFSDSESGLPCETRFEVLAVRGDRSLLLCRPITGRTNQIRLHLAAIRLPIVGDPVYRSPEDCQRASEDGDDPAQTLSIDSPPLCLHSWELSARHPRTGQPMTLKAAPPAWADDYLENLTSR